MEQIYTIREFISAVRENSIEAVERILNSNNSFINEKLTNDGDTAVLLACSADTICIDLIKVLIDHGADINVQNKQGETCLSNACKKDHYELVKLLLNKNVNLNCENHKNTDKHFLHVAVSNCQYRILEMILNHETAINIDLNVRNNILHTPIMAAIKRGKWNVVHLLLEHGAEVDIWTLYICASNNDSLNMEAFEHMFNLVIVRRNNEYKTDRKNDHHKIPTDFLKTLWDQSEKFLFHSLITNRKFWENQTGVDMLMRVLNESNVLPYLKMFPVYRHYFESYKLVTDDAMMMDKYVDVFSKLLDQIPFGSDEFVTFLKANLQEDILLKCFHLIHAKGNYNMDQNTVWTGFFHASLNMNVDRLKLLKLMMKYYIKFNYLQLIDVFVNVNERQVTSFWILDEVLKYSTPRSDVLTKYLHSNWRQIDADVIGQIRRVPSLLELARDSVRQHMGDCAENSKEYLGFIADLSLPKDYQDIIQLEKPLYHWDEYFRTIDDVNNDEDDDNGDDDDDDYDYYDFGIDSDGDDFVSQANVVPNNYEWPSCTE